MVLLLLRLPCACLHQCGAEDCRAESRQRAESTLLSLALIYDRKGALCRERLSSESCVPQILSDDDLDDGAIPCYTSLVGHTRVRK
ncbi:uncharacterized protein B0H18DRAFT_158783 [Fomitopsis serialis]|uniref:uncharacterized protein n=1 Tax=Fomitopsis serialis TaxID=139415 RepID=UPI002007459A|nr:uncharacterized protein B0H18DRAFT_158783 [Neoantrodia serialis]KAH9929997.1 hypothetical protein B0H18DRAFT_158783 [Neoantrodia serialis]